MFFTRRKAPLLKRDEVEQLLADWGTLARRVVDLTERQEALEDKHHRLRGVVYGRKLHKQPLTEEPTEEPQERRSSDTAHMSREELKRYLARSGRFIPGKPVTHGGE